MYHVFLSSSQRCGRKDDIDSRELDQRKTLQTQNVIKTADENDEFEKQRTAAIAEVSKAKEVITAVTRAHWRLFEKASCYSLT